MEKNRYFYYSFCKFAKRIIKLPIFFHSEVKMPWAAKRAMGDHCQKLSPVNYESHTFLIVHRAEFLAVISHGTFCFAKLVPKI